MHTPSVATQAIQTILAPAVMISASALFLLGLSARYIAVITRIRLLSEERRKFHIALKDSQDLHLLERDRLFSVEHQIAILQRAVWYLRNSILCQVLAAFFFVLTSCSIGLHFLMNIHPAEEISLALFMVGMVLILIGIALLGLDIFISYEVIAVEVRKSDETIHIKH